MKKIFTVIPCLIAGLVFGQPDAVMVEIANVSATTTTVSTASSTLNGYIESIRFDVTGTTTGAVTITSSDGESIYSGTITADTTVRPRMVTQGITGSNLDTGTNTYARYLMVMESLTVTLAETAVVTNSYKIKIKLDK